MRSTLEQRHPSTPTCPDCHDRLHPDVFEEQEILEETEAAASLTSSNILHHTIIDALGIHVSPVTDTSGPIHEGAHGGVPLPPRAEGLALPPSSSHQSHAQCSSIIRTSYR